MINYDFLILSSFEFEILSRDLLQKELVCTFESFTSGKDGGIDFRHTTDENGKIILQSKRYNGYGSLYNDLKKEVIKAKSLNPDRYILTTSVGLTPGNKESIIKLFEGLITNTSDIYG